MPLLKRNTDFIHQFLFSPERYQSRRTGKLDGVVAISNLVEELAFALTVLLSVAMTRDFAQYHFLRWSQ